MNYQPQDVEMRHNPALKMMQERTSPVTKEPHRSD